MLSNQNLALPTYIEESFVSPWLGDSIAKTSEPSSSFCARYESYREKIRFPVRDKSDRCDAYHVSSGMVMLIVDVACSHPFETQLSGQDIVEFHYRLSGSIAIAGKWGELLIREPSCLIWYQPNGCDDAAEQVGTRGDDRETWISLYCDRSWLSEYGGRYTVGLLKSLEMNVNIDGGAPHYRVQPQQAEAGRIMGDLLQARGDSALDWWYAHAKAVELLYLTLKNTQLNTVADSPLRRVCGSDLRLVRQARSILDTQLARPPRLGVLARLVGMNPTKLCALFRQCFGESVYEFVRRRRLELANELLTQSDMQIQQIAAAVGYRHHSTFSTAFSRHFGVAPKQVLATAGGISRDPLLRSISPSSRR
jgi:AraC-like DNA-binding protein